METDIQKQSELPSLNKQNLELCLERIAFQRLIHKVMTHENTEDENILRMQAIEKLTQEGYPAYLIWRIFDIWISAHQILELSQETIHSIIIAYRVLKSKIREVYPETWSFRKRYIIQPWALEKFTIFLESLKINLSWRYN